VKVNAGGNVLASVRIDEEFQGLIPPLSDEERAELERSILAEGCRDAVIGWEGEGILLDGHHRYAICEANSIPYEVRWESHPDRDSAMLRMIDIQRARRNLAQIDMVALLEHKRDILTRQAAARMKATLKRGTKAPAPADLPDRDERGETRDELAREVGVGARTYDKLRAVTQTGVSELVQALREHRASASAAAVIAELPEDEQREAVAQAEELDDFAAVAKKHKPHVSRNSGDNEWYTPKEYIAAAVAVMGGIDLDPASTEEANAVVGAGLYFSAEDDGLARAWSGRVWLNPPYASDLIGLFCEKLLTHYQAGDVTEACVLVNNATETQWFQALLGIASSVAFPAGRVKFWHPRKESAPLQGQAVLYLGNRIERFADAFGAFGAICYKTRKRAK